jgi:hypothetical protein
VDDVKKVSSLGTIDVAPKIEIIIKETRHKFGFDFHGTKSKEESRCKEKAQE